MQLGDELSTEKRAEMIANISPRILKNLEHYDEAGKLAYIGRILGITSDMHLLALNLAVEMTPVQGYTHAFYAPAEDLDSEEKG